ncbi:hypothetical protein [Flavobacterium sp. B183]|uniref:hypothetical protein n=1 Tax=Flavobacterium sp. B183 TaxID=907046 RepID=UPI00201F4D48|nr:hypothetical protein [Flavobacterium sp. B183]URC11010.1 hypothetical protein M4I44_12995 [Flavobacterium sp. B183]
MKKIIYLFLLTVILLSGSKTYSQKLYIVRHSMGSCVNECAALQSYFFMSGNTYIAPVAEFGDYHVFNVPPTYVELISIADTSFGCAWRDPMACYEQSTINMNDCFWGITNAVLPEPDVYTNLFCDKKTLTAVSCPGPYRFSWEYSTNGINFTPMNITTTPNQSFEFVKANYPALNNYTGTIIFRVLIDSDPNAPDENVYSNVATYNIIPCSPKLSATSDPNYTTCSYSNGSVTFTFSRPLEPGEKYLFNRNAVGSTFITDATSNDPDVEKVSALSYKWKNIPPGQYQFKFQTQFGNGTPSTLSAVTNFEIRQNTALTFWATAIQPECSNSLGFIEIHAAGGTSPYFYILDDQTEVVNGQTVPKKVGFSGYHQIPITADGGHKVVVVDASNCIEN